MKHLEVFTGGVGKVYDLVELANGNCVVNFSLAETPRVKVGDNWEDGVTIWTDLSIFGDEARNFVKSVVPGTRVLVVANRSARKYTAKDTNEERTVQSLVVEEIGVLINKFTFVKELGNVNYYKEGRGGGAQSAQASTQSYNQNKPASKQSGPALGTAPAMEDDIFNDDQDVEFDDGIFDDDSKDLFDL